MATGTVNLGKAPKRARTFAITRHHSYDSSPKNSRFPRMSQDDWIVEIKKFFNEIGSKDYIEYMAYIFHDRDLDDNGAVRELHAHAFVRFTEPQEQPFVKQLFDATSDNNCQSVNNYLGAALYLIHISSSARSEEKTMYAVEEVYEIKCRYRDLIKDEFWGKAKNGDNTHKLMDHGQAERLVDSLGLQIYEGKITKDQALEQLKDKGGYHWLRKHGSSFDADQQRYVDRRVKELSANGRNNRNIYIMGAGSIGKSTLAHALGTMLGDGKTPYDSSPIGKAKTPDVLDHYTDQDVAVFNEMNPHAFSMEEFLDCFDRHMYTAFPSRNENKHFIAHTSIFTNSTSPLRFAKELMIYSKGGSEYQDAGNKRELNDRHSTLDKYWQVRRRFTSFIVLLFDPVDSELVHGHVFNLRGQSMRPDGTINPHDGTHMLVGNFTFRCESGKKPDITNDTLHHIANLLEVSTSKRFHGETVIDEFLQANGIEDKLADDLLDDFIDRVVSRCVWDLLPSTFLYDLYLKFRQKFYSQDDLLNLRQFVQSMTLLLDGWKYSSDCRTSSKMDADEPLITEYGLDQFVPGSKPSPWSNPDYNYYGANAHPVNRRMFPRQDRYRGFVRK